MIDAAQVARDAAAYIREHGLAKGVLLQTGLDSKYNGKCGSACFNGALLIALGANPAAEYGDELWSVIGDFGRIPGREAERNCFHLINAVATFVLERRGVTYDLPVASPVMWNNEAARTTEEVAELLDEVAKELTPSAP